MESLEDGIIPTKHVLEVARLLRSYTFEWIEPRKDNIIVARSREMLGCIGTRERDTAMALRVSVEAHVSAFSRILAVGAPLPEPLPSQSPPARTKMLTIRVTPEEHGVIHAEAALRSKSVSELARELLVFTSSAPAETEHRENVVDLIGDDDDADFECP